MKHRESLSPKSAKSKMCQIYQALVYKQIYQALVYKQIYQALVCKQNASNSSSTGLQANLPSTGIQAKLSSTGLQAKCVEFIKHWPKTTIHICLYNLQRPHTQAVPQLRTSSNIKAFNNEMKQCDYDLSKWVGIVWLWSEQVSRDNVTLIWASD